MGFGKNGFINIVRSASTCELTVNRELLLGIYLMNPVQRLPRGHYNGVFSGKSLLLLRYNNNNMQIYANS